MGLKLKLFNNKNIPVGGRNLTATPLVTFILGGNITFNKAAACQFKLKEKQTVGFACDEEDDTKWFWFFDPENGVELRKKGETGILQTNHADVCKQIMRLNTKTEAKSTPMVVGETIDEDGFVLFELKIKS